MTEFKITPILSNDDKFFKDGRSKFFFQGPTFRTLVLGKTGSGKSQMVANCLANGWCPTSKVLLCLRRPNQPVYEGIYQRMAEAMEIENQKIRKKNEKIRKRNEKRKNESEESEEPEIEELTIEDLVQTFTDPKHLPDLEDFNIDEPTLIIFDDFIASPKESHKIIEEYFLAGRQKGISCFWITQHFHKTPQLIRDNCDYFCLFPKISDRRLTTIHPDVADDIEKAKDFKKLYREATSPDEALPYPFMLIDKKATDRRFQYRRGFDQLFSL